jgi:hypothetical protein
MSKTNNQLGTGKYFNEALSRLADKRDNNGGGTLLGKRMVHKSANAYNRKALRQADRRGDY